MRDRRKFVPFGVLVLFGSMAFFNVTTKPRFAGYYGPDVLSLIAVGLCFGAAIALLVMHLRAARTG